MRNALTVDLEEYFHVEAARGLVDRAEWTTLPSRVVASTRRLLDLFEARGVSATFFVVGWVAERHPALIRQVHERGHELGCHGYAHRTIYSMGREEFRDDLRRARRAIEDAAGVAVIGYRAPTCSVVADTLWALDILVEEGFRYDSSIFPIHHDRYGIPSAPRFPYRIPLAAGADIVEFPMSTVRVAAQNLPFAGGGYFRLAPYALIRAGIRWVNRHEDRPVMVYLHPWEIDPEQPRMPLRGLTGFRHYVGLAHTARKLDRLLSDFTFGPAAAVLRDQGMIEVAA
jgi:polysaccharide deacetylase family protein (PEP-CTERM system associated)